MNFSKRPLRFSAPLVNRAPSVVWTSLVFSMIASLGACSTNSPTMEDSDLDTQAVGVVGDENTPVPGSDDAKLADNFNNQGESSVESTEDTAQESGTARVVDRSFGTRRAPKVQDQPVQSGEHWLNAFYFVRSPEETWESMSQMIYGRTDRADFLAKWNSQGTLAVGRVIYYNSALRPADSTSIKVFSEDFGVALEQVTVAAGDSLSSLALARYGNVGGWKEIAALNNLDNADLIQVGQTLVIQPAQVATKAILEQVIAQASEPKVDPAAANAPPVAAEAAPSEEDSELAQLDPEQVEAPVVAAVEAAATQDDNSKYIYAAALLVFAALLIVVIRRRRAKDASKQGWDDSASVTKLTRPKANV